MTLLIGVCFLQPNIMVFKDLPKSFFKMQIKGISCEYESKILRTVQSAIPCCTMQYCSWLKVMSSSKETYEFCCQKILKITGVENLHIITIFSCKKHPPPKQTRAFWIQFTIGVGFISKFHKFAGMVKNGLYVTVYLQVSPWKHKHLVHNWVSMH